MNLAISNLAFPAEFRQKSLLKLREAGIEGIEVAFSRIKPWASLTPKDVKDYKAILSNNGLQTPSAQAIFFGLTNASLLGGSLEFHRLEERMKLVAELSAIMDIRVAVFGAPAVRQTGNLTPAEALETGLQRLSILESIVRPFGITLAIEPVPKEYGGQFLCRWEEVEKVVRALNLEFLRLHLDIGCVELAGDDISTAIRNGHDILSHFHAAEPELKDFSNPVLPHNRAGLCLREVGYNCWLTIEMKEPQENLLPVLTTAISYTREAYF
jgi:sugar phosphate isomerase/epimerase